MKLYADSAAKRTRQTVADLFLVGWIVAWLLIARNVHAATMLLAKPGVEMTQAGEGLGEKMRSAGSVVDGAPLIGGGLSAPFDGAGAAADRLAAAGASQVSAVGHLAFWLTLSVAAIPILLALAVHVPLRWRFVRGAAASQRFIDSAADLDLFALRALSRQPMHRLARISADPAGDWRRRDPVVVRALGVLELRDAGLRPPTR